MGLFKPSWDNEKEVRRFSFPPLVMGLLGLLPGFVFSGMNMSVQALAFDDGATTTLKWFRRIVYLSSGDLALLLIQLLVIGKNNVVKHGHLLGSHIRYEQLHEIIQYRGPVEV